MSLDVYLYGKPKMVECTCDTCGHVHKIKQREMLYTANITHNLGEMADETGIGDALWEPDKINAKNAGDLIPYLTSGIEKLKSDPEFYKQFNAKNGWGIYENLIEFTESYLEACQKYPDAEVEVSR